MSTDLLFKIGFNVVCIGCMGRMIVCHFKSVKLISFINHRGKEKITFNWTTHGERKRMMKQLFNETNDPAIKKAILDIFKYNQRQLYLFLSMIMLLIALIGLNPANYNRTH